MYCPNCREEYDLDTDICHNCETPLVELLPEEREAEPPGVHDGGQVTIISTANLAEFEDARALLEQAQIPYFAKGGDMPPYPGGGRLGYVPEVGPIDIQVGPENVPEARRVLAALLAFRNPDES